MTSADNEPIHAVTPGLPDEQFTSGNHPMTKREIRVLTVSKMKLQPNLTIWDVGAGTGSVSVEIARLVPENPVYAIEKDPSAIPCIRDNASKFGGENLEIVRGTAPDVLDELPDPDRIFIGGTGGRREDLFQTAVSRLQKGGRLVANTVTMDSISASYQLLQNSPLNIVDICGVSISKNEPVGDYQFMKARNQVFIMVAEK